MPDAPLQPDACRVPDPVVQRVLESLGTRVGDTEPHEVIHHGGFTNDIAEVRLSDGRTLMIKRGRYGWSPQRYRTSRIASVLLRQRTDIVAPAPLPLRDGIDSRPLEAYWRIDLPTLDDVWPALSRPERQDAMRSWGEMISRVHGIRLPGHGPLPDAMGRPAAPVDVLTEDLGGRLLPAVGAHWPEGHTIVERLLAALPSLGRRLRTEGALLHGDLHMGNVLCRREAGTVRCVGLLDLETAHAGPLESDLARLEIAATTLFSRPILPAYLLRVREGYGRELHAEALAFYRAYHYVNMGFHSALIGHDWHAAEVARAAREALGGIRAEQAPLVA